MNFERLSKNARVVFIPLDHEMLRLVKPRALSEISRDAADHVARIESGLAHDPGQERGRGRLPVRAGNDKIVPAAQKILPQHFRQRR